MPKVTVRPSKQDPNFKRIAVTGGVAAAVAVRDQSDATYIRRKANGAPLARFVVAKPTIPAGHDVATVVPGARLRQPTSNPPNHVTLAISVPGTGKPKGKVKPLANGPAVRAGSGTTIYDFAQPASQGRVAGPTGPWSGLLGKLALRLQDGHKAGSANRAYIYELWADVYCAARPTVTLATTPATPISGTSYPEVNATFSALVEEWQDNEGPAARSEVAYEMRIFSAAQYLAAGFDPASSPAAWSTQGISAPLDYIDGATPSSEQVDETPDVPLANGVYRVYARGRRMFEGARFGAWTYVAITIDVDACPAPLLSATLDGQRVALSLEAQATAGAADPLTWVERSADAGETWQPVRGAWPLESPFAQALSLHDYEAPRGAALTYRAATEASFEDVQLIGDAATVAVEGVIPAAGWNLKCPLEPAKSALDVSVDADPEWAQEEDAVTFRPIGRRAPVVVSMSLGGADGSLTITCRTAEEWAALEALRDYPGTLLLESPYGWARYVRILSRAWTEAGAPEAARRRVTFSFLEVEAP